METWDHRRRPISTCHRPTPEGFQTAASFRVCSLPSPARINPHHISGSTWQYLIYQRKEVVRIG